MSQTKSGTTDQLVSETDHVQLSRLVTEQSLHGRGIGAGYH
jgi:hypothetical protein